MNIPQLQTALTTISPLDQALAWKWRGDTEQVTLRLPLSDQLARTGGMGVRAGHDGSGRHRPWHWRSSAISDNSAPAHGTDGAAAFSNPCRAGWSGRRPASIRIGKSLAFGEIDIRSAADGKSVYAPLPPMRAVAADAASRINSSRSRPILLLRQRCTKWRLGTARLVLHEHRSRHCRAPIAARCPARATPSHHGPSQGPDGRRDTHRGRPVRPGVPSRCFLRPASAGRLGTPHAASTSWRARTSPIRLKAAFGYSTGRAEGLLGPVAAQPASAAKTSNRIGMEVSCPLTLADAARPTRTVPANL